MPEGDTIHYAANRIRPILEGHKPEIATHRRLERDRWPDRLAGRAVTGVDAYGKHLFLRFEGDLVIHSHLRMTGSWGTYTGGRRWRRAPSRAWLVLSADDAEAVQFGGPVLELLTAARARSDPRLAHLGPDVLAQRFDEPGFLRRLRHDDPARPIGDALLDQRIIAGLGTVWRAEACFAARIDPWRPTGEVSDAEAQAIVHAARPPMTQSARDGRQDPHKVVYGRAGRPCPRCGEPIMRRGQGASNRVTYWCGHCQL